MSKLQEFRLDENTVIYLEAAEDLAAPDSGGGDYGEGDQVRRGKGGGLMPGAAAQVAQSFQAIESTIKTYTKSTINAFRDGSMPNVKKVTIEFGVNVSGMGGVPYIASGTAGCNIKVTVECGFPDRPPAA
jgi:Trypsin-co-occurring domain 1